MKRKISIVLIMAIVFTLLAASVYSAVQMSVYSTSIYFQTNQTGLTRSYTGSSSGEDITWQGTTHTLNQTSSMSTTFTISLYKYRKWSSDQLIGQVTISREGYHSITWNSVGAGEYYFYYSKSNDGATVYSNDVILSMS